MAAGAVGAGMDAGRSLQTDPGQKGFQSVGSCDCQKSVKALEGPPIERVLTHFNGEPFSLNSHD